MIYNIKLSLARHSYDFTYLIAYGLMSEWTEWACLDPSDTEYTATRKRTQRVRYKMCTNPSEYDGGAYCGTDTNIREMETSAEGDAPLCYNGAWFCSGKGASDTEGTLGDGTTQGSCPSDKICFTYPESDKGCRGIRNYY